MEAQQAPIGPADPSVQATNPASIHNPERLAAKSMYAADLLKSVVQSAERLSKADKVLGRYLCQARLLLVWKRGGGAMKMAGSAAKTVGTLMLVAAPLHPRIATGVKVAHRLWKMGTGLKILTAIANMVRDVWQKGCREVLLEFTHCAATLTRDLGVFGEVLRDLQGNINGPALQAGPGLVISTIREFVPPHQVPYLTHVINMAFGNERYTPLFAFTALTVNSGNNSNIAQIMLEIESFHFDEFIETSESRALVAIGSFLHVSRELCDFLDGFQRLTERDCHFLQECLQRLGAESVSIMKAATVLVSLDKIRRQLADTETSGGNQAHSSLYDNQAHSSLYDNQAHSSLYDNRDVRQSSCSLTAVPEACQQRTRSICLPCHDSMILTQNAPPSDSPCGGQNSSQTMETDVLTADCLMQTNQQPQSCMTDVPSVAGLISNSELLDVSRNCEESGEATGQTLNQPHARADGRIAGLLKPLSSVISRGSSLFTARQSQLDKTSSSSAPGLSESEPVVVTDEGCPNEDILGSDIIKESGELTKQIPEEEYIQTRMARLFIPFSSIVARGSSLFSDRQSQLDNTRGPSERGLSPSEPLAVIDEGSADHGVSIVGQEH
ncbi:hypothetical protein EGW08_005240, partial [Elysia chlorotica]